MHVPCTVVPSYVCRRTAALALTAIYYTVECDNQATSAFVWVLDIGIRPRSEFGKGEYNVTVNSVRGKR